MFRTKSNRNTMTLITRSLSKPKSLPFSPLQRASTIKTRPCSCKVVNFGHLNSGFVTQWNRSCSSRKVLALANALSNIGAKEAEPEGKILDRILLSDVVVQSKREYWKRKWNTLDIASAAIVIATHLLSLFAPFQFNWPAFGVAAGLYLATGLGITLSFHRNLSHRSFKLPKWLEYLFAYCGVQALQVGLF